MDSSFPVPPAKRDRGKRMVSTSNTRMRHRASIRGAAGIIRRSLRTGGSGYDLDTARGIVASVGIAIVLWVALGAILGWWF